MRLNYMASLSAVLCGLLLLGGCGSSSSDGGSTPPATDQNTVTVDLIVDYNIVQSNETLTLGAPMVDSQLTGKRFFLDYAYDNGLKTMIVALNVDGNGTARNAPSADNGYDTNQTSLLTWGVESDGNMTAVVVAGSDTLDVMMTPIDDTGWVSENILTEIYNRTVGDVETRYPAVWSSTDSFDAATTYTNNCASCHDGTPGSVLDGMPADTAEVSMIKIKDDSSSTGNATMNDALDIYTVGQIRLLAEYIESLAP